MRILCCCILLVILLVGCTVFREQELSVPITQVAVCENVIEKDAYDLLSVAENTGIVIPGLAENFVPQGIAWWEERQCFVLSGYFKPESKTAPAMLVMVRWSDGKLIGAYSLKDEQGKLCSGHFSGVAITQEHLFVLDGSSLLRIPLEQIRRMSNGTLQSDVRLPLHIDAGACSYSDGMLWVSEYYRTDVVGKEKGGDDHPWMIGYHIDRRGELELKCVFHVPDRVQGICVVGNRVVFSRSYGRKNRSEITVCGDPRSNAPETFVKMDGCIVPMWSLVDIDEMRTYDAPPMSEGCCSVEDKVYLIFESGAYYYREFDPDNRAVDPTDRIWEIDLRKEKPLTGG